jgi:HK97 family phage major capsid protein
MKYEFKHIVLPEDHGLDDEHLKFLQTLDEALVKSREGISKEEDLEEIKKGFKKDLDNFRNELNYEALKKQVNELLIKFEEVKEKNPILSKEQRERKERDLNNRWIRSFLRKDKEGISSVEKLLKELKDDLEPVLQTDAGSNVLSGDVTQGSYLIPELLLAEVNRFVVSGSVARREMRYLPFSDPGNSRYIPTLLTNVTVDWPDEGEKKPKTKPYISRVKQTLKKVAAMVIMTEEIIEDTAVDLTSFCGQLLGEAIAAEEDDQFFAGNGTPWTGIINNADVATLALDAGETMEDVTPDDLLDMVSEIPEGAVNGGKYYMHRSVFATLRKYRSSAVAAGDGEGVYLVQDPTGSSPGTIWGYPVVLTEALPAIGNDTGENDYPFLIFGNLKKTCVYGDKKGIRVKLLDQASVYDDNDELINLAEQDMLALRVHKRVGYAIVLPDGICVLQTGASS